MAWVNFHSHTKFSDGCCEPVEYISKACELGLKAYGFSCHGPVHFDSNWNINPRHISDYLQSIELLKDKFGDKIQIYKGLEMDYLPDGEYCNREFINSLNLDYVIGSIHYVDNFSDNSSWNVDTKKRIFDKGLLEIFDGCPVKAVKRFYKLTVDMLYNMKPDVVGHLDKIKMFNKDNCYFSENDKWYKDVVVEVLEHIKVCNTIIELNTRGFYKKKSEEFYPSNFILQQAFEMSIPVMINSDCHKPDEIISGFPEAAKLLMNIGYKKLRVMYDNKFQDLPFDENGIIF